MSMPRKTEQQNRAEALFLGGRFLQTSLQCTQKNSLSFLHILDQGLLCKAYTSLVLLDIVKLSVIIHRKKKNLTCCDYDAFLHIISLNLHNSCVYIISPYSQVGYIGNPRCPTTGFKPHGSFEFSSPCPPPGSSQCSPWSLSDGPLSLAAGIKPMTTSPTVREESVFMNTVILKTMA